MHLSSPKESSFADWFSHSHLFDLARQGKRLTHILAVIPLAFFFAFFGQLGSIPILILIFLIYGLPEGVNINIDTSSAWVSGLWWAMLLVSSFILVYVLVGLWAWLFEKRQFHTLGYEHKDALKQYLRGFLIGALMFATGVGFLAVFGFVSFEQGNPNQQGWSALGGVLIILVGWIVQGGAEENVARGWVLPVLGARYRPWVGVAISSLIFAAMHSFNSYLTPIALLNLALFGLFAALYALREGSLWGISALHSSWNWVQGNIFGFTVSGSEFGGGSLLNLIGVGPDWMTGGQFGPEGGLAVTLSLVVSIGIVVFWKSKRS